MSRIATLGCTLKRRGPAAPGLTTSRRPSRWINARCVCPYTSTSASVPRQQLVGCGAANLVPVTHVDRVIPDRDVHRCLEIGVAGQVHVSIHGLNGRKDFKFLQHGMAADVSRMQQALHARERFEYLRTDQSVRIRDESNAHESR